MRKAARARPGLEPARGSRALAVPDWLARGLVAAITLLMLAYILLPVYWMAKSSLQSSFEIRAVPPIWVPGDPTLRAYEDAGYLIPVWQYLWNSIVVSVSAAVIATLIALSAAYALARYRFPGATVILALILIAQIIPPITRVFPIYFLVQGMGLLNTYLGAIIVYVGFSVPFAVLLLRGYFKSSAPRELEEAALIDGCSYLSAFWRVILPISLPGIAAVGIFTFLNAWNDFLWASLLLGQGSMKTIQVGIGDFATEGGGVQYVNAFMAACVLTTLPALAMFFVVQRWLVSGLTTGAVKA